MARLVPPLLLAVLVLAAYGRSIGFDFARDDFNLIARWDTWTFLGHGPYWRPLWRLWISLQSEVFGLTPQLFHLVSLVLHIANAILAYVFMCRVGLARTWALGAAAIWSLLAGNAYAAVWIAESNDLLAMCFLLIASLSWLEACARAAPAGPYGLLAMAAWAVSCLAKEVGVLWPVGAVAYARFCDSTGVGGYARGAGRFGPLLALAALASFRFWHFGTAASFQSAGEAGSASELAEAPWPLRVVGRAVHYLEGLAYAFLPLDLFRSAAGLWVGAIVGLALALFCVHVVTQVRSRAGGVRIPVPVVVMAGWMLLFSAHAIVTPAPRTLYVPTLGFAALLCGVFMLPVPTLHRRVGFSLLAVYLVTHVLLGQAVVRELAPGNPRSLAFHATLLKGRLISGESESYLRRALEGMDVDALAAQPLEEFSPWRQFAKDAFRKIRQLMASSP